MLVGGVFLSVDGVAYAGLFDWFGDNKKDAKVNDPKADRAKEIEAKIFSNRSLLIDGVKPLVDVSGKAYLDVNIFNPNRSAGAVTIYDKDNNKIGIKKIDAGRASTSITGFIVDDVIVKDYTALTDDYAFYDIRDAQKSTKTEIRKIEIPKGGRVEISMISDEAIGYNLLDAISNIGGALPVDISGNVGATEVVITEFIKAGLLELIKDPSFLKNPSVDGGASVKFIISTAIDIVKNPKLYDGRTVIGKVMKPVAKTMDSLSSYAAFAEGAAVFLDLYQRVQSINQFKKNNEYHMFTYDNVVGTYNYIATGSYTSNNPKPILPSAPREPDPSFIHQVILGNLPSNSDGGSAKNHMVNTSDFIGMKDITSGFKETLIAVNGSVEKSTNTNPVQSGQQQSTFLNTQPFSSTDWIVKEGASNNFVKTESFGSVIAPNNKPMAALNNANASHTVMERTFTVPTGVKNVSLGFNANFITNEFPAFVGSQFNDNVKVEVITASGNSYDIKTPFKESLNASQLQPVTGLPNPMMADGGQTGFKPVDVTNIPLAGGGAVTVRVTVENVGDQLYPSAALISDTQAKPR